MFSPVRLARRVSVVAATAGAVIALGAGPALAHECYNASRSTQGSTSVAAHSKIWADSFTFDQVIAWVGFAPLTAEQRARAEQILREQGVSSVVAIGGGSPFTMTCGPADDHWHCEAPNPAGKSVMQAGGTHGDIAANAPDAQKANGRGIDHLSQNHEIFEAYLAAYFAAGGTGPAA